MTAAMPSGSRSGLPAGRDAAPTAAFDVCNETHRAQRETARAFIFGQAAPGAQSLSAGRMRRLGTTQGRRRGRSHGRSSVIRREREQGDQGGRDVRVASAPRQPGRRADPGGRPAGPRDGRFAVSFLADARARDGADLAPLPAGLLRPLLRPRRRPGLRRRQCGAGAPGGRADARTIHVFGVDRAGGGRTFIERYAAPARACGGASGQSIAVAPRRRIARRFGVSTYAGAISVAAREPGRDLGG